MEEAVRLLIGGNFAPLQKELVGAEKAITDFANTVTAKTRKAAIEQAAAHEEAAKRTVAIAEKETRQLEAELEKQTLAVEKSAAKLVALEERNAQKLVKVKEDVAARVKALEEKGEAEKAKKLEATLAARLEAEKIAGEKRLANQRAEADKMRLQIKAEAERTNAALLANTKKVELERTAVLAAETAKRNLLEKQHQEFAAHQAAVLLEKEKGIQAARTADATKAVGSGIGALLSGTVAVGLGVGVKAAVDSMIEFEAVLNQVKAVTGATEIQLAALTTQALDLGAKTRFSAVEAAGGMAELSKAGFTVEQTMAALPGVLALAAAGGVSVADAAEVAGATLNGFGLAAADAGRVADILARAANLSAIGIGDLQLSMKYIASVGKSASQSLEGLSTAMVVMGNAGVKGEQAGTTIRAAIIRLQKPPKEAAEALQELGVATSNIMGNMLPLADILEQVREKTANYTEVNRNSAVASIFGQEALSGMLTLLNKTTDEYREAEKQVLAYNGASAQMADDMNRGLGATLEQLAGSAETIAIIFGTQFAPALKSVTEGLITVADFIGKLPKEFYAVGAGVTAFAIVLGTLAAGLLSLGAVVAIAGPAIAGLGLAMSAVGLEVAPLVVAIAGLAWVTGTGTAAMALLTGSMEDVTDASIKQNKEINALAAEYETLRSKANPTDNELFRMQQILERLNVLSPDLVSSTKDHTGAVMLDGRALEGRNDVMREEIRLREANLQLMRQQKAEAAGLAVATLQELEAQEKEMVAQAALADSYVLSPFNREKAATLAAAGAPRLADLRRQIAAMRAEAEAANVEYQKAMGWWNTDRERLGPQVPRANPYGQGDTAREQAMREKEEKRIAREAAAVQRTQTAATRRAEAERRRQAAAAKRNAEITRRAAGRQMDISDLMFGRHVAQTMSGQHQYAPRDYNGDGRRDEQHAGDDRPVPTGTPVKAVGGGTVVNYQKLASNVGGYVLEIRTLNNQLERYLHLSRAVVKVGDVVQPGDVIGASGAGPGGQHTHFELRSSNGAVMNVNEYAKRLLLERFGTTTRAGGRTIGATAAQMAKVIEEAAQAEFDAETRNRRRNIPQGAGRGDFGQRVNLAGQTTAGRQGYATDKGLFTNLATSNGKLAEELSEDDEALQRFVGTLEDADSQVARTKAGFNTLAGAIFSISQNGSIENIADQIRNLANDNNLDELSALTKSVGTAFNKAGGGAQGLGAAMNILQGQIDPVTVSLKFLAMALPPIVHGLDELINGPASIKEAARVLKEGFNSAESGLALGLSTELEALNEKMSTNLAVIKGLKDRYAELGGAVGEAADLANPLLAGANYRQKERNELKAAIALRKESNAQIQGSIDGINAETEALEKNSAALEANNAEIAAQNAEYAAEQKTKYETSNPNGVLDEYQKGLDSLALEAKSFGLSQEEVADKLQGLMSSAINNFNSAILALGGEGSIMTNSLVKARDVLIGQLNVVTRLEDTGRFRKRTEEEIAAIVEGTVGLQGEALELEIKRLSVETGISERILEQAAAAARLRKISDLQDEQKTLSTEIADTQARRLELEREITNLMRDQTAEAEKIKGESIAVRQETEAQYKLRKLAELEQEKLDTFARVGPEYESLRSTESAQLNRRADIQRQLQGFKGDLGQGTYREIDAALMAALNALYTLPKFHSGGLVPGSNNQETLAILRGGEVVSTPEQMRWEKLRNGAATGEPFAGPGMLAAMRTLASVTNNLGNQIVFNLTADYMTDGNKLARKIESVLSPYLKQNGIKQ